MKCTNLVLVTALVASTKSDYAAAAFVPGSSLFRSSTSTAFVSKSSRTSTTTTTTTSSSSSMLQMTIVSPFDAAGDAESDTATASPNASGGDNSNDDEVEDNGEPLDLTWDNVEKVLDTMRSYLIQDGGNVIIADIDGPVVKLELQGACGTCPSSTQTMKMGLERGLKERIPEIQEVIQSMPEGPPLNEDEINVVLDGVRPFLDVAGGSIGITSITGVDSVAPAILLKMEGASASLNSVKLEIAQRLQRHFMMSGLRVEWDE
jgi:Fe-S cluster biogenesis protein NfuA